MKHNRILKLVMAAMFASLVCVSTMVIKIPTPTNGYVNLGDCIVLLSGWLLGPVYGALAAAIGSCLADVFAGYPTYAVATFIIKGIVALLAFLIYRRRNFILAIVSSIVAELFMVFGYFLFEWLILGYGIGAAVGIPGNFVQGAVGAVLAILLLNVFTKNKALSGFFLPFQNK